MNRKIPFHEISSHIASITGIGVESAEQFVKNFFELLSESLISGESVRVKGIGTFSIVEADGERHIDFVADKEMSDAINAPFAMFEPVKLNDAVSDEMLSQIEADEQQEKEQPEQQEDNQVIETITETVTTPEPAVTEEVQISDTTETKNNTEVAEENIEVTPTIAPVIPPVYDTTVTKEETVATEVPVEPDKEPEAIVEEELVVPPAAEQEEKTPAEPTEPSVVNETIEEAPKQVAEESPKPVVAPVVSPVSKPQTMPVNITPLEEDTEEYVDRTVKNGNSGNGNFWSGLLTGLFVGIAIGACAVYFAIDYFFPSNNDAVEAENIEIEEVLPPIPLDSIEPENVSADTTVAVAAVASTPAETSQKVEEQPQAQTAAPTTPKIVKDTIRRGYLIHDIAKKFYGSKDFWVYIYEENKSKIGNPNNMQAGVVLVIPPAEKYGITPGNPESLRKARNKAAEILRKYPR